MYQQVKLDEVCVRKIETISSDENGLIDYFDIASVDNTKKKIISHQSLKVKEAPSRAKQIVQLNDILVSTVRPNLNAIAMIDNKTKNKMVASTGFCVLRASEKIEPRYLFYFVQSPTFINSMTAQATGASYPAVSNSIVKSSHIPLPDLPTQRRIADTLDKVSEGIGLCGRMMDELDLMVKAKFGEMFGDAHNNSAFPYKNIGDLTTVTSGGTPDRENNLYWDDGNIRWVKTTELQNCTICDTEEKITKLGLENSSAKLVPAGSVLIAMYGQGKTRGMTAYLENESATNQACACILPSSKINQKYLWKYLMLSYDKLRSMAKGGNQPNLNIGIIKNFPVLYPPIELQNQYVEFVIYIDKSILTIKGILAKMEEMKLALMQKCFKEGKHGE